MPLAEELKENFPGIQKVSRISEGSGSVKYGDNIFNESLQFVDPDFFEIFSFPLVNGKKDALRNKDAVIITDEIADKYFGMENPIGKQITISPDGEKKFLFTVEGVVEKPPKNSVILLDVVLNLERVDDIKEFDHETWDHWARGTIIKIGKNTSANEIEKQLQDYKQITNEANPDFQVERFYTIPLKQVAFDARDMNRTPFNEGMPPAAIATPAIMSIFVLLLACFNFINTAVAFASKRLKEIGIRKVLGGIRSQLIWQFLTENLILCFLALIVGMLLAKIFVPAYDSLWAYTEFSISYSGNLGLVGFLAGLLLFTAIAAGAYPAFYISKFSPVSIFTGKQKFGGTNPLIRVLLVFQFAISMTSLIGGIILYQNGEYISTIDLGFNKDQILVLPIRGGDDFNLIKSTMGNNPDILSIGASDDLMGKRGYGQDVEFDDNKLRVTFFDVGEKYIETLDFNILKGRSFSPELKIDIDNSIIVNETFVKETGLEDPVGKYIRVKISEQNKEYQIIGVTKDFLYRSVWSIIQPAAFLYVSPENYNFASIKFNVNRINDVSAFVKREWEKIFPNIPYGGYYQDSKLEKAANITNSIKLVFLYIALMVIITTCLGLFALVSLNIAKRSKEISIRKVLGASISSIGRLISKEFIILILISSIIASFMGYYLVYALLASIWAYYVDFSLIPYIMAGVIMLSLALISVSSQIFSIAKTNPIDKLRTE
jgi:ABC-type antimicrobial peptide transport system permease subunit